MVETLFNTALASKDSVITLPDAGVCRIKAMIAEYDPVTLAEIAQAELLSRVDTKFVMGVSHLYQVLPQMKEHYRVLDNNGVRLNHYQTVYFDTPDFTLYRQHHNGIGSRYKVRARKYVDSDLAFFEVKRRTSKARTVKTRIPIPDLSLKIDGTAYQFVDTYTPFAIDDLEPKLWNEYIRITLVSKHQLERVTLDLNLSFGWTENSSALPGIAIAEVKQERRSPHSAFVQQMRKLGIRSSSFSKYTAGVCALYDQVKINNFKPQIRRLNKIMQEELNHDLY